VHANVVWLALTDGHVTALLVAKGIPSTPQEAASKTASILVRTRYGPPRYRSRPRTDQLHRGRKRASYRRRSRQHDASQPLRLRRPSVHPAPTAVALERHRRPQIDPDQTTGLGRVTDPGPAHCGRGPQPRPCAVRARQRYRIFPRAGTGHSTSMISSPVSDPSAGRAPCAR
jgi:hypothetical protein